MSRTLQNLLPLFEREYGQLQPMVVATVIRTQGPSYTKPGAQMLIAQSGEYAGLLSGGCLEGDLSDRAARVLRNHNCELARYDMRGPDDLLFGLGSGCEGAMDILLQPLDAAWDWQPMRRLVAAWKAHRRERLLLVVPALQSETEARILGSSTLTSSSGESDGPAIGSGLFLEDGVPFGLHGPALDALQQLARKLPRGSGSRLLPASLTIASRTELFLLEQEAQPRILLLGAGADALPVATLASFLGWSVTVVDHRSHFAQAARFPQAEAVHGGGPQVVPRLLQDSPRGQFDAAIVMSHHLLTDAGYLRALMSSSIPYVGLLGPVVRRERLLSELGPEAVRLRERLRAPVGLDLGAASPEAIALSIVAEIQAVLSGTQDITPLSDKDIGADPAMAAIAFQEPL